MHWIIILILFSIWILNVFFRKLSKHQDDRSRKFSNEELLNLLRDFDLEDLGDEDGDNKDTEYVLDEVKSYNDEDDDLGTHLIVVAAAPVVQTTPVVARNITWSLDNPLLPKVPFSEQSGVKVIILDKNWIWGFSWPFAHPI